MVDEEDDDEEWEGCDPRVDDGGDDLGVEGKRGCRGGGASGC